MTAMTRPTVVVLGAGVAGLQCALTLTERVSVILIDKQAQHTMHGSLYRILSPEIDTEPVAIPIYQIVGRRRIRWYQDLVTAIDPIHQSVTLHMGGRISYDYLVVALGGQINTHDITGLSDHIYQFRTLADALVLGKRLHVKGRDNARITIVGAGLAGVELAGNLASQLPVDLIEKSSHILPGLSRSLSRNVEKALSLRGVAIYSGQTVVNVRPGQLTLQSGRTLPVDILLWAAGTVAPPLIKKAGFEISDAGRALVAPTLQARGFSRVYMVGDSASLHGRGRYAAAQGRLAARNVLRQLTGHSLKAFKPPTLPIFVPVDHETVYLSYKAFALSGRLARRIRDWAELWYMAGCQP